MRRKELFYYVTWGSNVTRDVHWCVTGFYQQIEISNIANQIHGFTIDYGKFILICFIVHWTKKNGSYVFASSLTASNTKHANLTRLPVTLSVLDILVIESAIMMSQALNWKIHSITYSFGQLEKIKSSLMYDNNIKRTGCLSYLSWFKKWFWFLFGCWASQGSQQILSGYWYWVEKNDRR